MIARAPLDALDALGLLLAAQRFDLSCEKRTQAQIETVLLGAGLSCRREVRLSPGDIIDFVAEHEIGIEVKIGGSEAEILRQLGRYAAHPRIAALLLVSAVGVRLPAGPDGRGLVGGKPAALIALGEAWV